MNFKSDRQRKAVMAKFTKGQVAWSVPHTSLVKLNDKYKVKGKTIWDIKILKPRGIDVPASVKESSLRRVYSPEERYEIRTDRSDPKWTRYQIWDKMDNSHIASYTSYWDADDVRKELIKEKRGLK